MSDTLEHSQVNEVSQIDEIRRTLALEASALSTEAEYEAAEASPGAEASAAPMGKRKGYWRSVGDLLKTPGFLKWAHDEFPQLDAELNEYQKDGQSRRSFLQLMGASIALAGFGAAGCRRPEAKILPYNKKPVDVVIGKGMYYASTFVLAGRPMGVLAQTYEGRPTKIEGNPLHPNSHGGTDVYAQASILDLYDPDRSRTYLQKGTPKTRDEFAAFADNLGKQLRGTGGAGLAILMEEAHSPAIDMVLENLGKTLPQAKVYVYDPLRPDAQLPQAVYDFSQAKVIVSLDCDIFGTEDQGTRYGRQFMEGRRIGDHGETGEMNQLYVVEPGVSSTGAISDHRLALKASEIGAFAQALLAALNGQESAGQFKDKAAKWIPVLAEALKNAGQGGVVVTGQRQPAAVHALVAQINKALGSTGKVVRYAKPARHGTLVQLAEQLRSGGVQTLVIAHGNPAYDAPADLKFGELIRQVPTTLRLGLHYDETSTLCAWHVPAAHYLESWGDAVALDGTISAIQPMIEPMFAGMTALELLARVSAFGKADPYELVRMSFKRYAGNKSDEKSWQQFLQEGVWSEKAKVELTDDFPAGGGELPQTAADQVEVCFAPDPSVYDGRFANNGWMQECPDPVTKLTWDNAALIGPELAQRLKIKTGALVKLEVNGGSLEVPVYVLPGMVDNSVVLPLGYGRTAAGSIGTGTGFNAYLLRTAAAMGFATSAKLTPTGKTYPLAVTQEHWAMDMDKYKSVADEQAEERGIIREVTPEQLKNDPEYVRSKGVHKPIHLSIYTEPTLTGANQWAMIVDLNACIGCNACVVACQAENNVPIVGKTQVMRGREMHWLRLDRYFTGDNNDQAQVALQPMMCQHCENAPCEPVCPVNATVHSPEGLNEMVYNRCIGTRYCSNNCPYKVRRFNYLDWNKGTLRAEPEAERAGGNQPDPLHGFTKPQSFQPPMQEMLKMAQNPNVTVRIRGVMEKCTFCVQRIESAKIAVRSEVGQGQANATVDGAAAVKVPQGMVVSACAQACPTQAIVFGDKSDVSSPFYQKWNAAHGKGNPRSYEVLEHLNVRPRTHYLAKVRNVNPKLVEAPERSTGHGASAGHEAHTPKAAEH